MRTRLILVLTLLITSFGTIARAQDDPFADMKAAMQATNERVDEIVSQNIASMQDAERQNEAATEASNQLTEQATADMNTTYTPALPLSAKPQFSLKPGKYTSVQSVTITDSTPGATIYYTTSGGSPTPHSDRYTGPVSIVDTTKLQAIAVTPGFSPSRTNSAKYTLQVTPPPLLLVVEEQTSQHTLTDNMSEAKIYYTLDGSTPTTSSTLYTGAILPGNVSLKTMAVAPGYAPSVERDFLNQNPK